MSKKVVLVTGSSAGGIGYALCEAFTSRGCTVYASARNIDSLKSLPASVHKLELDDTSDDSCRAAVKRILAAEGRIDVLVNNAGRGGTGALLDFTVDDARATFDVNFFAVVRLTQLVVRDMAERGSGLVINIGSVVGLVPTPWAGIYAASKAALHAWTDTLRMEVKGLGIDVMLVAPGAITSNFGNKQVESFHMPEENSMPASVLARGIVDRALRAKPAAYYSAGGMARLFYILLWLPRSVVWRLFSRMLGTDKVRPVARKQA